MRNISETTERDLFTRFVLYAGLHRARVIGVALMLLVCVAILDWKVSPDISLGHLYLFPILLAAGAMRRWQILLMCLTCAFLRESFGPFADHAIENVAPRIATVMIAYSATGLFVWETSRNRWLAHGHMLELREEIQRRREAEEQLQVLVETSPLAIVTLELEGRILRANRSAAELLGVEEGKLEGQNIVEFLPFFRHVRHFSFSTLSLRTQVEVRGRRSDGQIFMARAWFSTYDTASGPRLAAIVADISDDLREREEQGLEQLMKSSRLVVAAALHEVRNFCGAIGTLKSNLARIPQLAENEDFRALSVLTDGLEKIAQSELRQKSGHETEAVDVEAILEELRIIVEPGFHDSGISLEWFVQPGLPQVLADRHAVLQVFLNLASNSQRAMEQAQTKRVRIEATAGSERQAIIRFIDSGPGVPVPERLFAPFQDGASSSGLGLYVSRVMLRTFGGELRYDPLPAGCCFTVELPAASVAEGTTA